MTVNQLEMFVIAQYHLMMYCHYSLVTADTSYVTHNIKVHELIALLDKYHIVHPHGDLTWFTVHFHTFVPMMILSRQGIPIGDVRRLRRHLFN